MKAIKFEYHCEDMALDRALALDRIITTILELARVTFSGGYVEVEEDGEEVEATGSL